MGKEQRKNRRVKMLREGVVEGGREEEREQWREKELLCRKIKVIFKDRQSEWGCPIST